MINFNGLGLKGLNCSDVLLNGLACAPPPLPPYKANRPLLEELAVNNSLVCLAPAMAGFNAADPTSWPSTSSAAITLQQPPAEAGTVRGTFVYAASATPVLQSVTPSFYSSALSTTLHLNGSASDIKR